jgi:hypothetical protein
MYDSCAVRRIALDTMSCSSPEDNVHCAVSIVIPRQAIGGIVSKATGGGSVNVGGLTMTLTAGVADRLGVDGREIIEGGASSPRDT